MNKALLAILFFFVVSSSCPAQTEKYPFQTGDGDLVSGLSWSPRNDLILTTSGDENGLWSWDVHVAITIRLRLEPIDRALQPHDATGAALA